jgi:hypothetical protein
MTPPVDLLAGGDVTPSLAVVVDVGFFTTGVELTALVGNLVVVFGVDVTPSYW